MYWLRSLRRKTLEEIPVLIGELVDAIVNSETAADRSSRHRS